MEYHTALQSGWSETQVTTHGGTLPCRISFPTTCLIVDNSYKAELWELDPAPNASIKFLLQDQLHVSAYNCGCE